MVASYNYTDPDNQLECYATPEVIVPSIEFCGYKDHNMYMPLSSHPIFQYLLQTGRHEPVPSVDSLTSVSIGAGHADVIEQQSSNNSTSDYVLPSPCLPSFQASDKSKLLSTPSPTKQMIIDLTSPTPEKGLVSVKRARSNSIEISVAPETGFSPPTYRQHIPAPKRLRSNSIELLNFSSFPAKSDPVEPSLSSFKRSRSTSIELIPAPCPIVPNCDLKVKNQSKVVNGVVQQITFRCHQRALPKPTHSMKIDPSNHCQGKLAHIDCKAHINVILNEGGWHLNIVNREHNHPRFIPLGGTVSCPPTKEQRAAIADLSAISNLSRGQIASIVKSPTEFAKPLELHQISNIVTEKEKDNWFYDVKTDSNNTIVAIFWQTDIQVALGRHFSDILLNDNSYNRNQYGYALNMGLIIDSFGKSRNVFQSLHAIEDSQSYSWGNIVKQAQVILGGAFGEFMQAFWATYHAVSPEDFDCQWNELISTYSGIKEYLEREIYPFRKQWAWAWISTMFTAGVRTTGRVESENWVSKGLLSAKSSAMQVFDFANERISQQKTDETQRMRDHTINMFTNDNAYISTQWLLRLINNCGHRVEHLLRVTQINTSATHYVAILADGSYVLLKMPNLKFHIGLICAWWYKNPDIDPAKIPATSLEKEVAATAPGQLPCQGISFANNIALPSSNPLQATAIQPRPTDTLPARFVFNETQAAVKGLTMHVQTQEELDELLGKLATLQEDQVEELQCD
ncbi:hypothetical protein H0H92_003318 [Tricholoma furcatifolium]|nr:hypothetical protein H0H92_003318 [Tricholoma furcatifolium]